MTKFLVGLAVMGVLLFLFFRYVWPKLRTLMEKRQGEITTALEAAEAALKDADSADDERLKALAEGKAQAAEIVAQARRNAEQLAAESEAKAQADRDRIIANARSEVVLQRQRAIDDAAARLGDVVMEVVVQVIDREVDAQVHQALIDQAVTALFATTGSERAGMAR